MWLTSVLGVAAVVSASPVGVASRNEPSCRSVRLSVSGTAQNRNITGLPLDDEEALREAILADAFPRITISGSQTLAGTFCEPTVHNSNNGRLQVMFHSISSNRESWSALGGTEIGFTAYRPEQYSWVRYAAGKGYPTLAIDRLGNGLSSHPDPILVVQGPYEDELYHDLAQQIRAGTTNALPHAYSDLTWVGNSYGSLLGSTSAEKFPNDWTRYILTGFSRSVLPSLPGILLGAPAPAAVVLPARFGNLPPGYVTPSNEDAYVDSFFGIPANVDFDPEVTRRFTVQRDVLSVGQFVSVYSPSGMGVSPDYTGRVLVLTGERDNAFCGRGSSTLGTPECGDLLRQTNSLFPASQYNYRSVARTGHAIQLHKSSQTVYDIAHRFLAGETFQGGPPA